MDELHQQTVNLLSFQTLPQEQYDAQVAFNLLPQLGEAAKVQLGATEDRIRRHYADLADGQLPELALQMCRRQSSMDMLRRYWLSLAGTPLRTKLRWRWQVITSIL